MSNKTDEPGTGQQSSSAAAPKKYLGDAGEIRAGQGFDERVLDAYLSANVPGYRGPLQVQQFDGGQSNLTYRLNTQQANYVLRRKPPGVLLKSAHAVDREFRVMSALFRQGFPVPEPLVLCEDESIVGTMFYVMRHVPGRIFWDCTMPDLTREHRAAVFDSVNATLAALHNFKPESIGLGDFGRPGNYFARQITRWSGQYVASKTQDIPEMDRLIAWLPGAVPVDDGRASVIHGDFSFHNVLIHPTEPRVVAVLDWELSTLGHPLGDLTYHLMEWYRPAGIDLRGTLSGLDLALLRAHGHQEHRQSGLLSRIQPVPHRRHHAGHRRPDRGRNGGLDQCRRSRNARAPARRGRVARGLRGWSGVGGGDCGDRGSRRDPAAMRASRHGKGVCVPHVTAGRRAKGALLLVQALHLVQVLYPG